MSLSATQTWHIKAESWKWLIMMMKRPICRLFTTCQHVYPPQHIHAYVHSHRPWSTPWLHSRTGLDNGHIHTVKFQDWQSHLNAAVRPLNYRSVCVWYTTLSWNCDDWHHGKHSNDLASRVFGIRYSDQCNITETKDSLRSAILIKAVIRGAVVFCLCLERLLHRAHSFSVAMSTYYKCFWACCLSLAYKVIAFMELLKWACGGCDISVLF